jgi:hypothetical protein
MTLPNGTYRTKAGSTVELTGMSGGISRVSFDWLEEPNACIECHVDVTPQDWGDGTHHLVWWCEHCSGGSAVLFPDTDESESHDQ